MRLTCVLVHVKPDKVEEFIEATIANYHGTRKEAGNIRFDFIQQSDDRARFMIYEVFDSEESEANHKKTAHYQKWRDTVEGFMAEPRRGVKYNIIEPKEISKW